MNKKKLFIENFLVFGIGGILGKLISFVMVPITTRLMPNASYFGLNDLTSTISSFATPICVFGMYDAMYRMFFDKEDKKYKRVVCSTAFFFVLLLSLLVCLLMFIFRYGLSYLIFGDRVYLYLVMIAIISTFTGSTNCIFAAPTKMQNHKKTFLILGLCSSILGYIIAIPLLVKGYYVVALPISGMFCGLLYELAFVYINHNWFDFKLFDKNILKQLLIIAIPIVPNFLIYWVFNSSDKLMIQYFLGANEVGIYSVGAKLGHLSNLIYTAFAGGWQYFAFATMKDNNQVEVNTKIFEYLGIISFVATTFICAISPIVYKILFPDIYYRGYIVAPYLFLAPLCQMLFQVIANQFLVIKKTWPSFLILTMSAIINVVLNLLLIPKMGIEGASIATLFGFVFSVLISTIVLFKMQLFIYSLRFIIISILFILYFVGWRFVYKQNIFVAITMVILYVFIILMVYYHDVKKYINIKCHFKR